MTRTLKASVTAAWFPNFAALAARPFEPEALSLQDYGFVPWVRTGLAAAISADPAGLRAVVSVAVDLEDSADPAQRRTVSRELTLYGPGDVSAIDPGQILRREPNHGTVDAEASYVAHVEFARPDFPWLFSPLPVRDDRCTPWLALVVVEARRSRIDPSSGTLPPQLWTEKGELQDLAYNPHFAHAQVMGAARTADGLSQRGADATTVETRLSDEHAAANLSRLICPRRLAPDTDYIAALVPAFDCGRMSGLGLPGGSLAPAWSRSAGDAGEVINLPVYDSWSFSTAPGGNFQELAERIKPRPAPWRLGRREIDLATPGGALPTLPTGDPAGVQLLDCALVSPAADPAPGAAARPAWPLAHREALRARVDAANAADTDLPRVGARLYARYPRGTPHLGAVFGSPPQDAAAADADWFSQLNTDPLLRLVAGLGARVVQKDQEAIMQAAWTQVEGIRRANATLVWAGMAEIVTQSLNRRHLVPLELGRLLQVTRGVHAHAREPGRQRSLAAAVQLSRTAPGSTEAAFRRALRPQGPLGRRLGLSTTGSFVATAQGFVDQRLPVRLPDGILGVSAAGVRYLGAALLAERLATSPERAETQLHSRLRPLSAGSAVMRLQQGDWSAGGARGGIGDLLGRRLLERLDRAKIPGTKASVAAGPLAEIALGLALSGGALAAEGKTRLATLAKRAPKADLPLLRPRDLVPGDSRTGGSEISGPNLGGTGLSGTGLGGTGLGGTLPEAGRSGGPFGGAVLREEPVPRPHGGGLPGREGSAGRGGIGRPPIFDAPLEERIEAAPERRFETPLALAIAREIATLNRLGAAAIRQNAAILVTAMPVPAVVALDPGPLSLNRTALLSAIEPRANALAASKGRMLLSPDIIAADWLDRVGLRPVMTAPVFPRAMYQALEDYDRDWLVPGLGLIPDRDFITLLKVNSRFPEAFLIGANDEVGRELLWRSYPTDQRGTCFRRFWDAAEDELSPDIHRFARRPIGSHFAVGGAASPGRRADPLAVVLRGELMRRFPDTVVIAVRGKPGSDRPDFGAHDLDPETTQAMEARVLFQARLKPDFTVVGFDLSVAEALDPGLNWWIILAQNPTAPRFGFSSPDGVPLGASTTTRDALDWDDLPGVSAAGFLNPTGTLQVRDEESLPKTVRWPGNSAVIARVMLKNPIRAAFRAADLLGPLAG